MCLKSVRDRQERGNILFLILLAVILFAALSYAVTSSMRGGGKDASPEKARALASQLIQYGSLMENTVTRMRLAGDVPEWGLDFDDGSGPSVSNANATCTGQSCRLFTQGSLAGNMTPLKFGEEFVDTRFRAIGPSWGGGVGTSVEFKMVQIIDLGTSAPEVIFQIQGMPSAVCKAINEMLWGNGSAYGNESYGSTDSYTGTLTALPPNAGVLGDEAPYFFRGKNAGCVGREQLGQPYGGDFYQVIITR